MQDKTTTQRAKPTVCVRAGLGNSAAGKLADHTAWRLQQLGSLAVNGATVTRPAEAALRVLGKATNPETP